MVSDGISVLIELKVESKGEGPNPHRVPIIATAQPNRTISRLREKRNRS